MEIKSPKIAFSAILKQDEPVKIVKRCLDSVKGVVDGYYITITHKNKNPQNTELAKFLKKRGVHVSFFKWIDDFSAARNFAISQIPSEFDFFYWQDADDILQGAENLCRIAQEALLHNHDAVFFTYWYMVDVDKNGEIREVVIEHKRERLIRHNGKFKWIGRLHETLIQQQQENVTKVFRNECVVVHLTTKERTDVNLERNIRILEAAAKEENHKDPRTLMYLAKAYFDKGKILGGQKRKVWFDLARALFQEYLVGAGTLTTDYREGSGWAEERSTAWEYIGEMAKIEGQYNVATRAFHNALIESPKFPSYYLSLAMIYVYKQDWAKAEHWLNIAKLVPIPNTTIIQNPRDLKTRTLEIEYHIAVAKQDLERAEKAAIKLAEILPMEGTEKRKKVIKSLKLANQAAQSTLFLARYLEETGEKNKIPSLINSVPKGLEGEKFVAQMRQRFLPSRLWKENEIAIMCGPGFEEWSPRSLGRGLGGSEEAVVYLSKELTKLGYKITVYANPGAEAGEYDGVVYKPYYEFNIKDTYNILILWRAIGFMDMDFVAKQTYLWLHDVPNVADYTRERIEKADKIFVLSNYHKSLLRLNEGNNKFVKMPEEKIFVTGNGIVPLRVNKKRKRDPYRMIYMSSYDRGLVYLLGNWEKIRKEVPKATFHIFYGWNLFDFIHRNNPGRMAWKGQMMRLMKQEGIIHHGRVSHKELNREISMAGIWAYPTAFQEISCISAMRCQALGAIPVTTDYAALKETVQYGVKVPVNITEEEGQRRYIEELIGMLKNPQKQEEIRKKMMPWAQKHFLWENVARGWDKLFKSKKRGGVKLK